MIFYGPCPFVSCLDIDVHAHSVCSDCGAINHGNMGCATCVRSWPASRVSEQTRVALLAAIERRGQTSAP